MILDQIKRSPKIKFKFKDHDIFDLRSMILDLPMSANWPKKNSSTSILNLMVG
jgi:hypothetical protein